LMRRLRLVTAAALLVFLAGLVTPFGEVWRAGIRETVPVFPRYDQGEISNQDRFWKQAFESDQLFVTWLVARNAETLLSRPTQLYQSEQCHPAENMLALGEPMITLGLLGIPAWLATRDPVVTYNAVLVLVVLLSALAMYALVAEWTAVPAAGIPAGLLYAFHQIKISNVTHPYVDDTVWTLLALLFARRAFATGHWRDTVLAAICCALQIAGSFYPFVSAALLALPLLVWLFAHYGASKLRPGPSLAAMVIIGATAVLVFAPYLGSQGASSLEPRAIQSFEPWGAFLPGGSRFPGWLSLGLVLVALASGRKRTLAGIGGDPRWALLVGAALAAIAATGDASPWPVPDLWGWLAAAVPGLHSVRIPGAVASGVHLTLCILAGLGAAAVLRATPDKFRAYAAGALALLAFTTTLRPALLGLEPPVEYRALAARPSDEELDFFARLEASGSRGPLLEVPIGLENRLERTHQILLISYHRRRTSSCYNSYLPPEFDEVEALGQALPDAGPLDRLRELGFGTVVVHHPSGRNLRRLYAAKIAAAAGRPQSRLRPILASESLTAYEILPDGGREDHE